MFESMGSSQPGECEMTGTETAPTSAMSRNGCIIPFPLRVDLLSWPRVVTNLFARAGCVFMIALTNNQMQPLDYTWREPARKGVSHEEKRKYEYLTGRVGVV